jgi:hypothetical protein
VNENLRQALLRSPLRERDIATHLEVDPKTVRRWLEGRVPYPANRAALADLLNTEETQLWPEVRGPLVSGSRPEELLAIYPHRWAIPRETWSRFFAAAGREIGILAYSSLFLAEDAGLLQIIGDKGRQGVEVRICLGAPNSSYVANRGVEEGIGDAMPAKVRNALALYGPLNEIPNVEIKLHSTVLYNTIYLADAQLLVNQHVYGSPAAHSPVFHFAEGGPGAMAKGYRESFCRVWESAVPVSSGPVGSRR